MKPRAYGCALAAIALGACSSIAEDARIGVGAPPRSEFDAVGKYLDHRCGSLDCHGDRRRNLILFGCEGLRLDPQLSPGCRANGGTDTTVPELDATYRSLVTLEPAVMSAVVAGHGKNPELLAFVRKPRGDEGHKGGTLITPGDAQDKCITSWLTGKTDGDACAAAMQVP
jgi:hypothetical protein